MTLIGSILTSTAVPADLRPWCTTSNEAMVLVRKHDFERRRRTADFFVMKKGDLTVFVPRDADMDDKAWAQLLKKTELLVIAFRESPRRIESRERHPTSARSKI